MICTSYQSVGEYSLYQLQLFYKLIISIFSILSIDFINVNTRGVRPTLLTFFVKSVGLTPMILVVDKPE